MTALALHDTECSGLIIRAQWICKVVQGLPTAWAGVCSKRGAGDKAVSGEYFL